MLYMYNAVSMGYMIHMYLLIRTKAVNSVQEMNATVKYKVARTDFM